MNKVIIEGKPLTLDADAVSFLFQHPTIQCRSRVVHPLLKRSSSWKRALRVAPRGGRHVWKAPAIKRERLAPRVGARRISYQLAKSAAVANWWSRSQKCTLRCSDRDRNYRKQDDDFHSKSRVQIWFRVISHLLLILSKPIASYRLLRLLSTKIVA